MNITKYFLLITCMTFSVSTSPFLNNNLTAFSFILPSYMGYHVAAFVKKAFNPSQANFFKQLIVLSESIKRHSVQGNRRAMITYLAKETIRYTVNGLVSPFDTATTGINLLDKTNHYSYE